MKHIIFACFLLTASSAFAQEVSSLTGSVTGDFEALNVNIVITGIGVSQMKANPTDADFLSHLAIILPDYRNKFPILNTTTFKTVTTNNTNPFFYFQVISAIPTQDPTNPTNFRQISYNIIIRSNTNATPSVTLKSIASGSGVNVTARFVQLLSSGSYDDPMANPAKETEKTTLIQNILTSPSLAPAKFSATGVYKGLLVSWDDKASVDYVPATTPPIKQTPSQVLLMVFDQASTNVPLTAFNASTTTSYTANTSCAFNSGAVGGSTCISCLTPDPKGIGTWITNDEPENAGAVFFKYVPNSGTYTVPGLDPDLSYTVAIQYEKGIKQTCSDLVQPTVNYTVTEKNGGEPSKQGDPRCFIVSAAFGSPFNRHVDIFRWARDRFLEPFAWGHEFVEFYYNHSQPFADLVKASPVLQTIVKVFLYPLAFLLYALQECTQYPILSILFAGILISFFLWMRRRRLSL